ncbi:MAG TPA: DUF5606 domain-containing protein [Bacteroidales bacterium]|nr:DUF5606 domain-containing protein [Bacteroidales bacterium]
MVLKDILAISGEQGLFRFLAQGKNAIIVEHLETGKRSSAHGTSKVSSLEDIAIFTETEDVPLSKVFDLIFDKENGGPAIDTKADNGKLAKWFGEVLPDYSKNKVYASDIRKIAQWYNILHKLNLLVKEAPEEAKEEEKSEAPEVKESEAPAEKVKKASPKKKSSKSSES